MPRRGANEVEGTPGLLQQEEQGQEELVRVVTVHHTLREARVQGEHVPQQHQGLEFWPLTT